MLKSIISAEDPLEDSARIDITRLVIDQQCGHFFDQSTIEGTLASGRSNRGDCICCRRPLRNNMVTPSQFFADVEALLPIEGLRSEDIAAAKQKLKALNIQDGDVVGINEQMPQLPQASSTSAIFPGLTGLTMQAEAPPVTIDFSPIELSLEFHIPEYHIPEFHIPEFHIPELIEPIMPDEAPPVPIRLLNSIKGTARRLLTRGFLC